jgi:hypothetical protein
MNTESGAADLWGSVDMSPVHSLAEGVARRCQVVNEIDGLPSQDVVIRHFGVKFPKLKSVCYLGRAMLSRYSVCSVAQEKSSPSA